MQTQPWWCRVAGLLFGLSFALMAPGPAAAGGPVHIEDSLFNIYGSSFAGFSPQNYSNTCRGTKFRVDRPGTLVSFGLPVSAGNPNYSFYVYESTTQNGTFSRIDRATRDFVPWNSNTYPVQYARGLGQQLEAGMYYVALACWDSSEAVSYSYGAFVPEDMAVGESLESVAHPFNTLGSTETFPQNFSHAPSLRLVFAAGEPLNMAPEDITLVTSTDASGGNGQLLGNIWSITEDRVLLGFDQLVEVQTLLTTSVQFAWAVYSCPTPTGSSCGPSSTWTLEASSGLSLPGFAPEPATWIRAEGIQVPLEAGNDYLIGLQWSDSRVGGVYFVPSSAPSPNYGVVDWATSRGRGYINSSSLSSSTVLTGQANNRRVGQQLYSVPGQADSMSANTAPWSLGATDVLGSVFELTTSTRLEEISFFHPSDFGDSYEFAVYRSISGALGPWDRMESRSVQLFGETQSQWRSVGPVGIDLDANYGGLGSTHYMFALAGTAGMEFGKHIQSLVPHPGFSIGTLEGVYESTGHTGLGQSLPQTNGLSGPEALALFFEHCQDCVDLDLDGFSVVEDCDDHDSSNFPGNTEVCDGQDNDCDGLPLTDEVDADADGFMLCDGDCDDNWATDYPGAPEICDGWDNDCDGVLPADEQDSDQDGVAICAGDCDDSEADVSPSLLEDCFDGLDNDCDSAVDAADTDCASGDDDDAAGDDDDAAGDDDDSAGDDDDATGDDDDAAGNDDDSAGGDDDDATEDDEEGTTLIDAGDLEGPGLIGGSDCAGCSSSVSADLGRSSSGLLGTLMLFVLGLRRFRPRRGRSPRALRGPSPRLSGWSLILMMSLVGLPAQAGVADEERADQAAQDAWAQVEAQDWDAALESARLIRTLQPSRKDFLLIMALANEGKGDLSRARSYLLTYRELMRGLRPHEAMAPLIKRLEEATGEFLGSKRRVTKTGSARGSSSPEPSAVRVRVRRSPGTFGEGHVLVGGLIGYRNFLQSPCTDGGCSIDQETRPGLWGYEAGGAGAALSVRGEYFFARSPVGGRARLELSPGQPVSGHGVEELPDAVNVRLDAHVLGRIPLSRGRVGVQLLPDFHYGLRTFDLLAHVSASESAAFRQIAHQVGGGLGLRLEPSRSIGVEGRFGFALSGVDEPRVSDLQAEVAVMLRPLRRLAVRIAADFRSGGWLASGLPQEDAGAETSTVVQDVAVGLWAGVGVGF